jgi:hypothetical protein
MTTDTHVPPRYKRFLIRYPSGTVIESYYLIGGGGPPADGTMVT